MQIKPQEFHTQLKKGQFSPVYCFTGEDTYLQEEAWQRLEKALAVDSLNREVLMAGETSVNDIILGMQTMPFISDRRLMVIKEANRLKSGDAEKLAEFLRIPVETTCIVLLWPEKIKKDRRKNPLLTVAEKSGVVVEFRQLYDRELPSWIRDRAAGAGKRIAEDAVRLLIQESGSGLMDLRNEMEKLLLYTGSKKVIELQDVAALSGHTRQASLNQLAEAVEQRAVARAVELTERLLSEGEIPLRVLATVNRCLRRLLTARSMLEEKGASRQEIGRTVYLHPFFDKGFFTNLDRYTLKELTAALAQIQKADLQLKTTERPESMIIEELLLGLSSRR